MIAADKIGTDDARIDITLANGKSLTIDNTRLPAKGLKIEESCSGSSKFEIGYTTEKVLTLIIKNTDEYYALVDFEGAILKPYIINNSVATQKGTYKANNAVKSKGLITITAYDDMCRLENSIATSAFTFPGTHKQIMTQLATACGIQMESRGFSNSALTITEIPSKIKTYRELAGYIAQCAGSVFRQSNSGIFGFYDYNKSAFPTGGLDGGDFLNYNTGDTADGGTLIDYTSGATASGGTFGDRSNVHVISGLKSLKVGQNDTVITGVRITVDKVNYDSGTTDYMLTVSNNPLITTDNVQQVLTVLATKYIGLRFRTITCGMKSDFRIEAMDPAYACDLKGNVYQFYVTKVTYTIRSNTSVSCSAETKTSNSAGANNKTTTKLLEMADEEASKKLNEAVSNIDNSMQQLANQIATSSGLYLTTEVQADGSIIYYMHDKSTLATSQIVYKFTAQAFGISTDGGITYPYGLDASGDMVMNTIAARGFLFDWAKGGTITLGGDNNGNGQLTVLDSDGNQVGTISKDGLKAIKGLIGNMTIDSEGMFASGFGLSSVHTNDEICMYAGGVRTHMNTANFKLYYDGSAIFKDTFGTTETRISGSGFRSKSQWGDYLDLTGNLFSAMTIWKAADEANLNDSVSMKLNHEAMYISKGTSIFNIYDGAKVSHNEMTLHDGDSTFSSMKATGISTSGSLYVSGSKHRVVDTDDYGKIMMNAYETPAPMFGDIGDGEMDEIGYCYIALDEKFTETLDSSSEYYVFLTKYGAGDLYVAEREKNYFVVKGTANLQFAWEIKSVQKDYNTERMDTYQSETAMETYNSDSIDYASVGAGFLEEYEKEITNNEESN